MSLCGYLWVLQNLLPWRHLPSGAVEHRQSLLLPVVHCFDWLYLKVGFCFSPFNQDMGFGRLIHRCHRYLKDLISEALPGIDTSVINNTLGSSFGLRCQVALGIHLVPVNPTNVWSIYVQACLYCSSSFLDGKKFRSSWKPDWGCFDTRMWAAVANCTLLLVSVWVPVRL